ncbi:MAG: 30S ribosomal protein S20 [Akkermansiaceae bacterium]|jgi:small subunit ribosomal protein S20|nr:30S ribosomal protein S20 [Akkermansiaceae bacterium]
MANTKSAEKRVRQIAKRTERNRATKSRIKTLQKKAVSAAGEGNSDEARKTFQEFTKAVDKATKRNIFQKNKAANLKSRTNKAIKPA